MTASVPKAELHLHLEGAAAPALVRDKAAKYNVDIAGLLDDDGRYRWHDFTSFLAAYDLASSVFRAPEDFADLAFDYLERCHGEGVIYSEIFASPDHAAAVGLSAADYLAGVSAGMARAEAQFGIIARIIPICVRHLGPEQAAATARAVTRISDPRLAGFGMAGEERLFHPADFRPAFAIAAEAGLALTVHAGELAGADSVRAAIDHLPVRRIGHGVRAIEDAELVRRLADEGHVLECCPGSNIALKVFADFAGHPFPELRRQGVRVTLNSDDPPYFHTSIGREYRIAAEAFGLGADDLVAITRLAVESAFCDQPTKEKLLARLP